MDFSADQLRRQIQDAQQREQLGEPYLLRVTPGAARK
jgi:hypothetical protein